MPTTGVQQLERLFDEMRRAGELYQRHADRNVKLQNLALEKVFEFGEKARLDETYLEQIVRSHQLPWNKTTRTNPYNALVRLVFRGEDEKKKAWISQCATTLQFAHEIKPNEPLARWLSVTGGITTRYEEARAHFQRTRHQRVERSKQERRELAVASLTSNPISPPLPGIVSGLAPGIYRALVHFDGSNTSIVKIVGQENDPEVDQQLLELVPADAVEHHALSERPLYGVYRAFSTILAACDWFEPADSALLLYRSRRDGNTALTVDFAASAYSFTNARFDLVDPSLIFRDEMVCCCSLENARRFVRDFDTDGHWSINEINGEYALRTDANSVEPIPLPRLNEAAMSRLRVGSELGARSQGFILGIENLAAFTRFHRQALRWFKAQNRELLTPQPVPSRLRLRPIGKSFEASIPGVPNLVTDLFQFQKPPTLSNHRELPLREFHRLCEALAAYGDDVAGYIAAADVADAALCLEQSFSDGDRLTIRMPFVVSLKMDRTLICQPLKAAELANAEPIQKDPPKRSREAPVYFPPEPYPCHGMFGAYIVSFLPSEPSFAEKRLEKFDEQLSWWRQMTDIPINVVLSGWSDDDVAGFNELQWLAERGGKIVRRPSAPLIHNRIEALRQLYASNFDWGIMMDDDAILFDGPKYNSGAAFFAEMARHASDAYADVDVFFPINPRKRPGFSPIWKKDPDAFRDKHVFQKSFDLKGSMFLVRNFPKFDRSPILPQDNFLLHGEDTLFAIEALAKGRTVFRCGNIILKELTSESHFEKDRTERMKEGAEEMAKMYRTRGLRMSTTEGKHHLLDRKEFERQCCPNHPERVTVPKPQPALKRPW